MHKFTIGCDPEFFLRERKSGKLISAIPHINGTKQEPHRLPLGGNIQRDNVAVEVATDPADSQQKFVDSISNTLKEAIKLLPENNGNMYYKQEMYRGGIQELSRICRRIDK